MSSHTLPPSPNSTVFPPQMITLPMGVATAPILAEEEYKFTSFIIARGTKVLHSY